MKARGRQQRAALRLTRAVRVKGDLPPFKTAAQVRAFLRELDAEHRAMLTWGHLAHTLEQAEATGDVADLTVTLQLVLSMNGLLDTA